MSYYSLASRSRPARRHAVLLVAVGRPVAGANRRRRNEGGGGRGARHGARHSGLGEDGCAECGHRRVVRHISGGFRRKLRHVADGRLEGGNGRGDARVVVEEVVGSCVEKRVAENLEMLLLLIARFKVLVALLHARLAPAQKICVVLVLRAQNKRAEEVREVAVKFVEFKGAGFKYLEAVSLLLHNLKRLLRRHVGEDGVRNVSHLLLVKVLRDEHVDAVHADSAGEDEYHTKHNTEHVAGREDPQCGGRRARVNRRRLKVANVPVGGVGGGASALFQEGFGVSRPKSGCAAPWAHTENSRRVGIYDHDTSQHTHTQPLRNQKHLHLCGGGGGGGGH